MKFEEKVGFLKENHYKKWCDTYWEVEGEESKKNSMFCVCGKLATGLHESMCKKFARHVRKETVKRLAHLIKTDKGK